jgi:hypothetical protein
LQVWDACLIELTRQPQSPVQTDHQLKGKPGLQPQVHRAPLPVLKVKVVVQAASGAQMQLGRVRDRVLE